MEYHGTDKLINGLDPLVSVITCTYQHAEFIKQCLDGILMQRTNFPFEIIVGEDESTDGTRQICIEYAEKHPDKIRLFLRSRKDVIHINGKATGRYNLIENLKTARGKYIALCEGDDYWTDINKLQKQVDFLETNSGYAICFHEATSLFENGIEQRYNNISDDATFNFLDLVQRNFISTASCMFRVYDHIRVLPLWFSQIGVADWGLNLLNASKGKVFFMPDCMSTYRIHKAGAWSSLPPEEMCNKGLKIMDELNAAFDYKYDEYFKEAKRKRIAAYRKQFGETPKYSLGKRAVRKLKSFLK